MAVAIRMKRIGRRHRPFYRIEAIEKRNARDGKSLETLGTYDPFAVKEDEQVKLQVERIQHWVGQGARPSDAVSAFLRSVDVKWEQKKSRRARQRAAKKKKS